MRRILATTYAVNPYKGSENGMGWNFLLQIASHQEVIAITRRNNREDIERYMQEFPDERYERMTFLYFDLPYWMRFWKKGGRGAMLYYYLWQLYLPFWVLTQKVSYDIVHNVNFHNDWTPTLLWILGKPLVWGPVGHHSKIPKAFIKPIYGMKAYVKDRATWALKKVFWNLDPFLRAGSIMSKKVLVMNSDVQKRLSINASKVVRLPSVATEDNCGNFISKKGSTFHLISVGRFVPLKGFDVTIRAFAHFYHQLTTVQKEKTSLTLVGSGPELPLLEKIIKNCKVEGRVKIIQWIPRNELMDIYRKADAFLFPSHEGAGMVVAEAMSFGLPVFCLDNTGPGEFINTNCGVMVSPKRGYDSVVKGLGNAMLRVFQNPVLKKEMAQAARNRYLDFFTWDSRAQVLKEIYNQVSYEKESVLFSPAK